MIDFSQKIEAVRIDGYVSAAEVGSLGDRRVVHIDAIGPNWYVDDDGDVTSQWFVRNVEAEA